MGRESGVLQTVSVVPVNHRSTGVTPRCVRKLRRSSKWYRLSEQSTNSKSLCVWGEMQLNCKDELYE